MACLFCETNKELLYEDDLVFAIYDAYPVTKGHILVIVKRHIESYFQTTKEERRALDKAIFTLKSILDKETMPDGYNIGINNGRAAGQTVMHLHIHLIPRYNGDTKDPRGGVRGVIANRQKY